MAQTANRDTGKNEADKATDTAKEATGKTADLAKETAGRTADTVKDVTSRTADAARDMGEQVRAPMARLVEQTTSTAKEATARSTGAMRQMLDVPAQTANEAFKAEGELAAFWLDLTREQMQHNVDTLQRLASARNLRDAIEIQSEYFRESMARVAEGMTRQLDLAGSVANRMFSVGREKLDKAS